MKNIEIITSQNVVLQYELAGLKERILAFVLDIVILSVSLTILLTIGSALFGYDETLRTILAVTLSCIFIFYS